MGRVKCLYLITICLLVVSLVFVRNHHPSITSSDGVVVPERYDQIPRARPIQIPRQRAMEMPEPVKRLRWQLGEVKHEEHEMYKVLHLDKEWKVKGHDDVIRPQKPNIHDIAPRPESEKRQIEPLSKRQMQDVKISWRAYHKRHCQTLHMETTLPENFHRKLFKQFLVDDRRKLLFCQIPKVATTTWRRIFLALTGKVNTTELTSLQPADVHHGTFNHYLTYLSDLSRDEIRYRLKHYFKFVFVREPLERILSAYRSKFASQHKSAEHYRKLVGYYIAKKYRKHPKVDIDPENPNATFAEFVNFLTEESPLSVSDNHWKHFHRLCNPCSAQFDYIARLEDAQAESERILKMAGIDDIIHFPTRKESRYVSPKTNLLMQDEYSKLSSKDLNNLIKHYNADYILFNYTVPSFAERP